MAKNWTFLNSTLGINSSYIAPSGTRTSFSLNSSFVFNTSGSAIAICIRCPTAEQITEFYVFADDVNGTPGSTSLQATVRDEGPSASRPGTTVHATSSSVSYPTASDKWIKFTFGTPYTPSVNEIVWILVENTSASPSVDFPGIMTFTNTSFRQTGLGNAFTSTTGFSSNGTGASEMPHVVKIGSEYFGQPFTQTIAGSLPASSSNPRGILVDDSAKYFPINGFLTLEGNASAWEVFGNNDPPSATPIFQQAGITGYATRNIWLTTPAVQLTGNGPFRVVYTPTVSTAGLRTGEIEDYASYSSVFDYFFDGWNLCCLTYSDGTNWVDDRSKCPVIVVPIDKPVIPTAGGAPLIGPGGLVY